MRSLIQAAVIATVLSAPVFSFAQSNAPLTRAQVRAELIELERAGYRGDDNVHYPDAIQAAEARVAAQHGTASGHGGVEAASSQSGAPTSHQAPSDSGLIYFGQ